VPFLSLRPVLVFLFLTVTCSIWSSGLGHFVSDVWAPGAGIYFIYMFVAGYRLIDDSYGKAMSVFAILALAGILIVAGALTWHEDPDGAVTFFKPPFRYIITVLSVLIGLNLARLARAHQIRTFGPKRHPLF